MNNRLSQSLMLFVSVLVFSVINNVVANTEATREVHTAEPQPSPSPSPASTSHSTSIAVTKPSPTDLWRKAARRLFGETTSVRSKNIEILKSVPDLKERLREALKSPADRGLALDVISALKIYALLPELFSEAKNDETGHSLLTINELTTTQNRQQVIEFYATRLQDPRTATVAQIIALDTLGRSRHALPISFLKSWLAHGDPDQKSAGLTYLRRLDKAFPSEIQQELLRSALLKAPYQVEIQALYDFQGPTIMEWLCKEAIQADVRKRCRELAPAVISQEKTN